MKKISKTAIKAYAKLLVRCGISVKKGDHVIINASVESAQFVELLTAECYRAGAAKVVFEWTYMPTEKLGIKNMSLRELSTVENFEEAKLKYRLDKNASMLYILSDDPDGLAGIDREKYSKAMEKRLKVIKPYRREMDNKYKWCIAAIPGKKWASKVFPGERSSSACEKLWNAILFSSRVIDENGDLLDPIAEWDKHNKSFEGRCRILNNAGLTELRYRSKNGTDLKVGLIENGSFCGGGENTLYGEYFNPNIPSEEIFTSPCAGKAEGIVYSTMPLSWRGEIIDNFSVRFENGKAVEVHAEKGEELLKKMISADENACMLGECALVPLDSPIYKSGIMFYETLFDENATCHLALGEGFTNTVRDYDKYTNEELHEMGINDSTIHVDFMIGSDTLSITGIKKDGSEFQIFKNGKWAF